MGEAPDGVGHWVLHLDGDLDEVDRHWAVLAAAGMVAAAEVDGRAAVYFPHRVDDLGVRGTWERVPDRDWHERWRDGLTPVRAGRWTVTPSWLATGAEDELVLDPGQAFGTGHHETTQVCLEALATIALGGRTVLDVGTGSGVLAIAAADAGATVTAVDTDPLAVAAASANADRNGAHVALAQGSVDAVRGRSYDVVVANLDTATLVALAADLARAVAAGGTLLASGVSNVRNEEVRAALTGVGLDVTVRSGAEWTLVRAQRRPA